MARGPDPGKLLARALTVSAAAAGVVLAAEPVTARPYASAIYTGSIERVALSARAGIAFDAWMAGLAEAEIAMRRHLLIDTAIVTDVRVSGHVRMIVDALVLEMD